MTAGPLESLAPKPILSPSGIFIAGTDTGVGKTAITCVLVAALRKRGFSVGVCKPVATGAVKIKKLPADLHHLSSKTHYYSTDALCLAKAAMSKDEYKLINPVCLKHPFSPTAAARKAGLQISFKKIFASVRELRRRHSFLLMEGAGGLFVPLNSRAMVINLIRFLRMPVILVARSGLGTLNHTLLSCFALKKLKIPILSVVLNNWKGTVIEQHNLYDLRRRLTVPVLPFGYSPGIKTDRLKVRKTAETSSQLDFIVNQLDFSLKRSKLTHGNPVQEAE